MLRISNITLTVHEDLSLLTNKAAKILGVFPQEIKKLNIVKQSVDARKKSQIHYNITVDVSLKESKKEEKILKRPPSKHISKAKFTPYRFPKLERIPKHPVVVGLGPSGLMAALFLARAGCPPVIIERGEGVEERTKSVETFLKTGVLNPESNIQFGEGGAGTFSDGKLTTGTKDPRHQTLLQLLVDFGAPEDILYSNKPHIGTDILREVLKNIRKELLSLGCDLRFSHKLVDIQTQGDCISGIIVEHKGTQTSLPCSDLVLAIGHSARDTFTMLHEAKVPMESKNFAIGVRIEHLQEEISKAQYGEVWEKLPVTDYKLSCHLPSGRSAFSFCVCPGGEVVSATSSEGRLVTNGMSYRKRDNKNINGGYLVGVTQEDFGNFGKGHPLAGMWFQEHWEKIAFEVGGSNYQAPCQRVEDFLQKRPSTGCGSVNPTYAPSVSYGDVRLCLPDYISDTLAESLPILGGKLQGFDAPDALLTGIETRSSSPVRIPRDEGFQSTLKGLYPCGEGAGYAGGIMSAGVDGIRVAEAMVTRSPI